MIKFEIIITAWEDGLFKGRRRIEHIDNDDTSVLDKVEKAVNDICDKIVEDKTKWQKIIEDDDIPF